MAKKKLDPSYQVPKWLLILTVVALLFVQMSDRDYFSLTTKINDVQITKRSMGIYTSELEVPSTATPVPATGPETVKTYFMNNVLLGCLGDMDKDTLEDCSKLGTIAVLHALAIIMLLLSLTPKYGEIIEPVAIIVLIAAASLTFVEMDDHKSMGLKHAKAGFGIADDKECADLDPSNTGCVTEEEGLSFYLNIVILILCALLFVQTGLGINMIWGKKGKGVSDRFSWD